MFRFSISVYPKNGAKNAENNIFHIKNMTRLCSTFAIYSCRFIYLLDCIILRNHRAPTPNGRHV